jgi:hypothetical protein
VIEKANTTLSRVRVLTVKKGIRSQAVRSPESTARLCNGWQLPKDCRRPTSRNQTSPPSQMQMRRARGQLKHSWPVLFEERRKSVGTLSRHSAISEIIKQAFSKVTCRPFWSRLVCSERTAIEQMDWPLYRGREGNVWLGTLLAPTPCVGARSYGDSSPPVQMPPVTFTWSCCRNIKEMEEGCVLCTALPSQYSFCPFAVETETIGTFGEALAHKHDLEWRLIGGHGYTSVS